MQSADSRHDRGFTIIELMVVVSIITLLVGVSSRVLRPDHAARSRGEGLPGGVLRRIVQYKSISWRP